MKQNQDKLICSNILWSQKKKETVIKLQFSTWWAVFNENRTLSLAKVLTKLRHESCIYNIKIARAKNRNLKYDTQKLYFMVQNCSNYVIIIGRYHLYQYRKNLIPSPTSVGHNCRKGGQPKKFKYQGLFNISWQLIFSNDPPTNHEAKNQHHFLLHKEYNFFRV